MASLISLHMLCEFIINLPDAITEQREPPASQLSAPRIDGVHQLQAMAWVA